MSHIIPRGLGRLSWASVPGWAWVRPAAVFLLRNHLTTALYTPPSHPPIRQGESQHVMTVPRAVRCLELICKATRMLLARAELPVARPQHTIAELPGLTRRTPEADGGASAGEVPSTLAHGRCGGSRLRLLRRGHNMRSCGAGTTVARGSCILTERGAADVSRRV